jgi:biopolymer transport protein ExbB
MILAIQNHFYMIESYIAGGGKVMVPLVLASFVMWTLIIERLFFFRRLYRKNMPREKARDCIQKNLAPDPKKFRGAISLLVNRFLQERSGNSHLDRHILDETVIHLVSAMDKGLALIGVLAGAAPLMGLLGTVIGMIATFDIIAVFGTGNPRAMAGGISEALITTQTGLLVAIPGLYMKSFLERRSENLKQRIASVGIYLRRYV